MLKLTENPPVVFPEELFSRAGSWCVAHTKSRMEKAFAWELLRKGIGFFLPMIERTYSSGGRTRRGLVPLFGGYVFVRGDSQASRAAMDNQRLCQIIAVGDQEKLTEELASLYRVLQEGRSVEPAGMTIGTNCRIIDGPLKGVEGIVVKRQGLLRLVIQVSLLGQGAELAVEPELIEPV